MRVTVIVDGVAAPQGSKVRTRYGMRESSKRVAPWRAAVERAAVAAGDQAGLLDALEPPYRIEAHFYFRKPRTSRQKYPTAPTIGDGDKLTRATWDALTSAGLIVDDRHAIEWSGSKRWAGPDETPGAVIVVSEIGEA